MATSQRRNATRAPARAGARERVGAPDTSARRAREQRTAAEIHAQEADARAARLASRAERRARELTASRDTAHEQLAEAEGALRQAERRIETLERQRDEARVDAERELGRAARA